MADMPRVMIVDDDQISSGLLQTLLEMDGFEVLIVPRGGEAFAKAESFMPDIFIVDYQLNDMSGIDLIMELRSSAAFGNTPIVMASGRDVGREAQAAGADMFLVKPYDPGHLSEQLMDLIT